MCVSGQGCVWPGYPGTSCGNGSEAPPEVGPASPPCAICLACLCQGSNLAPVCPLGFLAPSPMQLSPQDGPFWSVGRKYRLPGPVPIVPLAVDVVILCFPHSLPQISLWCSALPPGCPPGNKPWLHPTVWALVLGYVHHGQSCHCCVVQGFQTLQALDEESSCLVQPLGS